MNHVLIAGMAVFFSSLLCTLAVYFKNIKNKLIITWALFCITCGVWGQTLSMVYNAPISPQTIILIKISLAASICSMVIFLHFVSALVARKIAEREWVSYYVITALVCATGIASPTLLVEQIAGVSPDIMTARYGYVYYSMLALLLYFMTYSVVLFVHAVSEGTIAKKKQFVCGIIVVGGSISSACSVLFPITPYPIFAVALYTVPVYLMGATYIVMDNPSVMKRSSMYGLMIALITGIYLFSIFIFENVFRNWMGYQSMFARFAAAIIIAITFLPLRSILERGIDRLFFRTRYDYNATMRSFSSKLVHMLELSPLIDTVAQTIVETFKVERLLVLLFDKQEQSYCVKYAQGIEELPEEMTVHMKHPIVHRLKTSHDMLSRRMVTGKDKTSSNIGKYLDQCKSELCIPLFFAEQLEGIIILGKKKSGEVFDDEDIVLLKTISTESAIALSNALTYTGLKRSYWGTVRALANAVEAKDIYTCGHSERVVGYTIAIAREMGLSFKEMEVLQFGGMLHDIGKIAVHDVILRKKTGLDDTERTTIQVHALVGEEIVTPIQFLSDIRPIVRHHHERWDGTGYPDKLFKNNIPLFARIVQVGDAFDALTSSRSYRPALTMEEGIREVQRCVGSQFDPTIVYYFMRAFKKGFLMQYTDLGKKYIGDLKEKFV